jgi:hypothetical protein
MPAAHRGALVGRDRPRAMQDAESVPGGSITSCRSRYTRKNARRNQEHRGSHQCMSYKSIPGNRYFSNSIWAAITKLVALAHQRHPQRTG